MADNTAIDNLDKQNVNATKDQILEELTKTEPGTEKYGELCRQLKDIYDVESAMKEDLRKDETLVLDKKQRFFDGVFKVVKMVFGGVCMVAVAIIPAAGKAYLDNKELLIPRELDDVEKENRKDSKKFFENQMDR